MPEHGTVELKHPDQSLRPTTTFTMADIYENRVTYRHDGTESLTDTFWFVLSDSTHSEFVVTSQGAEDLVTREAQVRNSLSCIVVHMYSSASF